MDFQQSFFKAKAVKPPVELAPTAVNSAVVIQAGHMKFGDFVSVHLLQRTRTGVLDTFDELFAVGIAAGPSQVSTEIASIPVKPRP